MTLPPELWLSVFHHAAHVPGTLVPDVYDHASFFGSIYTKSCDAALRDALLTKRALVRVCKQWWHLATPHLYASVYIGRARCMPSLSGTLVRSAAGRGTLVSTRPLGEYTQRLDIAIRDRSVDAVAENESITTLIACMPHLAIVSIAITPNYFAGARADLLNHILDALRCNAASLRVLDWASSRLEPSALRFADLLAKSTQLRVLNCPRLIWSKELQHGGIPPTLTTLHVHGLIPVHVATAYSHLLPHYDPDASRRPGPSALRELILDLNRDSYHWKDLLEVYSAQLVSVQLYIPNLFPIDVDGHLRFLAQVCPDLRRLTIISDRFSSYIRPRLVFPSLTHLALRATRPQLPRSEFETLFALLEGLKSSVPSLRVVQLVGEHNVQCLLRTHSKFAVRALRPFTDATSFRVEDKEGLSLADRLEALGHAWRSLPQNGP